MTDWRPAGWALLVLGLVNSIWGAYELGAGGDDTFLLLSGVSCLTIWLVVHDELEADAETDPDREGSA